MRDLRRWIEAAVFWSTYPFALLFVGLLFPVRVTGARRVPKEGPLLILSNHQSFLDPVLIGMTLGRPLHYVARETLFRFAPFRWLITGLGAIPIDQEGFAKAGLKRTLESLADGASVVLFPEGTRTEDGELSPLQRGVMLMLRRARAPIVLVGISGAFESYPIHSPFPIPTPIWVHFRQWKPPEPFERRKGLAELEAALAETLETARRRRRRLCRFAWTAPLTDRRPRRRSSLATGAEMDSNLRAVR